MPLVSVIMPVFNQQRYVDQAVKSILDQTFKDFEFIIVDDGSTDGTVEIIERFDDKRIRLIRAEHKGFTEALKRATAEAKGKWLARMDSDDLCVPERLEKQLDFLTAHPECVFVTTFYGIVTVNDKFLAPLQSSKWHYLSPRDISLATVPFCDPGTVFSRDLAVEIGYDDQFKWEKTLWYSLLGKGKGAVMEEPLYFTRWRAGSVSRGQNEYPVNMSYELQHKYDPENAVKKVRHPTNKIEIKNEKDGVYYHRAAGDFREAWKMAFGVWLRFPFNSETIKLALYSLGIRNSKDILGPADVKLYRAVPRPRLNNSR